VINNVHSTDPPKDNLEAMRLAVLCLEEARENGISNDELEAACGEDLIKCLFDAQVAVADANIGRLMDGGDDSKNKK
jgi:hypothetical protein